MCNILCNRAVYGFDAITEMNYVIQSNRPQIQPQMVFPVPLHYGNSYHVPEKQS